MNQSNESLQDDEIDLSELVSTLWRRKRFIIGFISVAVFATSFFIARIPNLYQSSVLIMFEQSAVSNDSIQRLLSGDITSAGNTETELQLIKGRRFSGQIVDSLSLVSYPEFAVTLPENTEMSESELAQFIRKSAIDKVSSNISVQQKSGTELIAISYKSKNPVLAALIANEIGTRFVSFKHELMMGKQSANSKLITDKLLSVKNNLDQAEVNIINYQTKHSFVDINTAISLSNTKLKKLHSQKQSLDQKIEQSNILKNHINQSQRNTDALLAIPMLVSSKLVNEAKQEINKQQKSFDIIKLKYGTKHPKYIESNRLLNDAKTNLLYEIDKQVGQINKQLDIHKDNLSYVEQQIQIHNSRLKDLGIINFDYQKLKRKFDGYLSLYATLIKKQNESDLLQDLTNTSNTILVEKAEISTSPVSPKRNLMLVLSIIGSLCIASLLVFIEAMLGDKVAQLKRVASKFETTVIGIIPKIKIRKSEKKEVITHINQNMYGEFIEAIRSIRTSILLNKQLAKQKVIAITSINPNDGKSSLSIQLANCFSELENVLLLDADLRFPSIAKALGEDTNQPGLTDLILNNNSFEQVIVKQKKLNFDVVTSGGIPNNPLVLLSDSKVQSIIESMKEKYDRVIIECPPVMSVSDAYIVSKYVDSVYLVIDAEKTNANRLVDVLQELQQANMTVGGLLINKVKKNNTPYSTSYYVDNNYKYSSNPQ